MKPYYDEGGITIYHGDCRELASGFPHADLLLTDPPYGISYEVHPRDGKASKRAGERVIGDDQPFDPRWLLPLAHRHVIFGANYFAHLLPPGGWYVWSKAQDNRWAYGKASARSMAEVAWTDAHRYVGLFNCFWAGSPLYRKTERGSNLHPTQKPVELMQYILERTRLRMAIWYSIRSWAVVPSRVHAGTSGRKYIGIEIEERYCEIAANRLVQEVLDLGPAA